MPVKKIIPLKLSKFYFFMVPALVFYVAIVASQSLRQYNDEHL